MNWTKTAEYLVVGALAVMVPAGVILAVMFDSPGWLVFTLIGLILFMAG